MPKQPHTRTTKSKSHEDNFYEIEKIAKHRINEMSLRLEMKMARLGGKILWDESSAQSIWRFTINEWIYIRI